MQTVMLSFQVFSSYSVRHLYAPLSWKPVLGVFQLMETPFGKAAAPARIWVTFLQ